MEKSQISDTVCTPLCFISMPPIITVPLFGELGLWTICTQPVVIIGENDVQEKTHLKNLGDSIPARSGVLDLWHWAMSY